MPRILQEIERVMVSQTLYYRAMIVSSYPTKYHNRSVILTAAKIIHILIASVFLKQKINRCLVLCEKNLKTQNLFIFISN